MNRMVQLFTKSHPKAVDKQIVAVQAKSLPMATVEEAVRAKRVTSRLASNAINVGDLLMEGGLQILGTHEGDLCITGNRSVLWIEEKGKVLGHIDAPEVYVRGTVKGSIRTALLILEGDAHIEGEVQADRILSRDIGNMTLNLRAVSKETIVEQPSATVVQIPLTA